MLQEKPEMEKRKTGTLREQQSLVFTRLKYRYELICLLGGYLLGVHKAINRLASFVLCILIATSTASIFIIPAIAVSTTVKVDPNQLVTSKNSVFVVNITLLNVTDLYGWQFDLYWNRTIINCTQAEVHVPSVWIDSNFVAGKDLQNEYNATHGRYSKLMCGLRPAPAFNGSMALATLTFKALNIGFTALDLQDTKLVSYNIIDPQPIPHVELDGTVTVLPPPLYMRSDQHTVNNATMYKLVENHTQTAASMNSSLTDPENEAYCYWGVRVWKRSSTGTETELTSGSPVAVVSRTSSGSGLQSATWACPATNLSVTDCLVVRVYYKFDWTSYTQCSQFITLQLNATNLAASMWTVYYYTQRSYNSGTHKTYIYYYWDNNYNSRIENICCN